MKLKHSLIALAVAGIFNTAYAGTTATNQETNEINTVLKVGGVTAAWSRGITGKGSTIAIIDQGFDLTQSDISGKIIASKNFYTLGGPVTWGEHGTAVAGIAAGAQNGAGTVGVAPDAKLILAQVGSGGTSTGVSASAIKSAIDWASAQGATVINLSLGSAYDTNFVKGVTTLAPGVFKAPAQYGPMYGMSGDIGAYAVGTGRGSIIVAAAGNGINGTGLAYSQFPGAFATQVDSTGKLVLGGRMIIVGASDSTGTSMASFSNRAGTICTNVSTDGKACNDPYLVKDFYVVAPGMQVYSSAANQLNLGTNGAIPMTGTSMATAYVSGGMALMKQAWPQLKPEQLVSLVLNTARPMGDSNIYGHGMVDFNAATQPMGALQLANNTKLNGSGLQGKTTPIAGTGLVSGGAVSLTTSSVLQNAQAVDQIGRNYTVNLAQAQTSVNLMSYSYASPWMSMAGANYKQLTTPIGKDGVLTFMGSDNGAATQYDFKVNEDTRANFEFGTMNEKNGFLGTQGYGAMGFGGSQTVWFGGGMTKRLAEKTSVFGNYTMGITRTSNIADSMVQLDQAVVSDSWKLGVAQERVFINSGKLKDTFSFAVAQPVQVRSGYATVSGVTSYSYSDNGDGTSTANPITQRERVSLAPQIREMDLVVGYNVSYSNTTSAGINYVRQFNAGGQAGVQSNGVALMVRSVF
jgi:subtilisin family serine protease